MTSNSFSCPYELVRTKSTDILAFRPLHGYYRPMTEQKHPGGRPTDYRPEYGDMILQLMSDGYSLTASAAMLDLYPQRVYEWEQRHPEFADKLKLARAKRLARIEQRLWDSDSSAHVTRTIFALKQFPGEWSDKHDLNVKSTNTTATVDLTDLDETEAARRYAEFIKGT